MSNNKKIERTDRWSGKCWHCGKDVFEESVKSNLHLVACAECRAKGIAVFSSLEAISKEEKRWGRRAFE